MQPRSLVAILAQARDRGVRKRGMDPAVCPHVQVTKVFQEYTGTTIDFSSHWNVQLNLALTRLVRVIANEHGWLEGWKALAMACPDCGMHDQLMQDGKPASDFQLGAG